MTLPAVPSSVGVVRHMLGAVTGVWPLSLAALDDLRIAVSEACANVVLHAYPARAGGLLEVCGAVEGREVTVTVRDQGVGMSPPADDPGIGLALIGALTTRVEVATPRDGGHQVRMFFTDGPGRW